MPIQSFCALHLRVRNIDSFNACAKYRSAATLSASLVATSKGGSWVRCGPPLSPPKRGCRSVWSPRRADGEPHDGGRHPRRASRSADGCQPGRALATVPLNRIPRTHCISYPTLHARQNVLHSILSVRVGCDCFKQIRRTPNCGCKAGHEEMVMVLAMSSLIYLR